MRVAILEELARARTEKRAVVLMTRLPVGEEVLIDPSGPAPEGVTRAQMEAARTAAARDACVTIEEDRGASLFFHPHNPPLRLIIVGAVHVAQPLAKMAALADFDVTVVDPRTAFSTEARFPGVTRVTTWPDVALAELGLDRRSAVVTLTHDPKLDDPALITALRSEAFYIGCLGSGKTHASRIERLRQQGFGDAELGRLFGPVGLRIGARSPAEIAVSILAQIVEQLRGGGARSESSRGGAG